MATIAEDRMLAQRVAEGDREAMERFVRSHHAAIFRALRLMTNSVDDAEDLTQQTLLRARDKIHTYRGEAPLRAWLHRVAFHEFTRWRRDRKRLTGLTEQGLDERGVTEPRFAQTVDAQWLQEALAALPEPMRISIVLLEVEQMSVDEIAAITSVPPGTVKSRLFHARTRLRELLRDKDEEVEGHGRSA